MSIQNTNCVVMPLKGFCTLKSYVMWVERLWNWWRLTAEHVVHICLHYCWERSADLRSDCGHSPITSGLLVKIFRDTCRSVHRAAPVSKMCSLLFCIPHWSVCSCIAVPRKKLVVKEFLALFEVRRFLIVFKRPRLWSISRARWFQSTLSPPAYWLFILILPLTRTPWSILCFCTVRCNIIIQHKPPKCAFSKVIF